MVVNLFSNNTKKKKKFRTFSFFPLPSSFVKARSAFTIIELLVASLLLGLIVTILTMIFNQSSIAWRIAKAGAVDLDNIRDNIAELREEADNVFIVKQGRTPQVYRHVGLWDSRGNLRDRACDAPGSQVDGDKRLNANILRQAANLSRQDDMSPKTAFRPVNVKSPGNPNSVKNYSVNVMSAGPDREWDTWDDIWSWPDDFE